jgi:hypothetical protein
MSASLESPVRQQLLGAWKLLEWSDRHADGTIGYPFGKDAIGQIVYSPDGHVAAQLVSRDRQRFRSGDWGKAGSEEAARAFREYFGYFGTFVIDADRQVVIHRVEGAWFPNLEGSCQERHFQFEDDRLVLTAGTSWGQVRIIWQRAPSAS